jgi:hypothetical protein
MSATSVTRVMILTGVAMAMAAWGARPQASPVTIQNGGQPQVEAQPTSPAQTQTTAPAQDRPNGGDLVLLERIEAILANAVPSGTDLKSAGKVTMPRADVAEILALVRELKVKAAATPPVPH